MKPLGARARGIQPSATLELAARARQLRAEGVDVLDLSVGEPDLATPAPVVEAARRASRFGAYRFCIVTATRGPSCADLDTLCPAVEEIKRDVNIGVCCSLGMLKGDQAQQLADAGVDRFNHNLETSEAQYEKVVGTHTYADRIETVEATRAAGRSAHPRAATERFGDAVRRLR